MRLSDIIQHEKEVVMTEILNCEPSFKVMNLCKGEDGYVVHTTKKVSGYIHPGTFFLGYQDDVADKIAKHEKHYEYIVELWSQYPRFCLINEVLQKYRVFKIDDVGVIKLTGQLILPNTTECGFGGGDYEIKRTPEREKKFLQNIDKFTLILTKAVVELQEVKAKFLTETANFMVEA